MHSRTYVNNHDFRLMASLPEANPRYERMTIITSQGIFQLNQEINQFICLISVEEFANKSDSAEDDF